MTLLQGTHPTRRHVLAGAAAIAALGPLVRPARAKTLKVLRFGIGLKAMSSITINTVIGEVLGYNRAEGFTLKPLALGTNANVQVALDRSDIEIGIGVPSFFVPLLAKGEWKSDVNFYEYTYPYKWDVAVLPGSPIKNYQDLKGKRVGVSGFGSTEYPVTKAVLKGLGIDPTKDVHWIAVGEGVAAGVALKRGAIDALAYYDVGFGEIEGAGIKLDFLPRPANLPMVGGQFLMTRRAVLASDRALVVGFGRSVCKASQFILANPKAGARAFLKMYPAAAPRGSTTEHAVAVIAQAIGRRIRLYRPPYPGVKMGSINPAEFVAEAKLDGVKVGNVHPLYTNALIDEINDFDAKAIAAEAAAYPT
ncbi:MAG: ABC transporter substrate-binding protein [Rhodospirillales bacterium]|nr:ABC transporter substrate-binding protein [Rhodospirillales bacterium]